MGRAALGSTSFRYFVLVASPLPYTSLTQEIVILRKFSDICIMLDHGTMEDLYLHLQKFITEERLQKIEEQSLRSSDFILPVMEDVYQFRNAAAIVRSTEGCGFHKIVAMEKMNVFDPNLDLTKGAENWVEIEKVSAHLDSIKEIKSRGYKIVAVSPERNATMLPDFKIEEPIALTFGTEWEGVTEEILDFADETLAIPMYGFTQSFNVSVAAAICLYDLKQKLIQNNIPHLLSAEKRTELKVRWAMNSIKSGKEIVEKYKRDHQL